MMPIIINVLGFMQENKHNHYPSDEELDAVLSLAEYSIVTPPAGYAPMVAPHRLMATAIMEVGGFQI
jgi:splicing factor 3B subunit 1